MNIIKCACGQVGCTTELYFYRESSSVDLIIDHKDENGHTRQTRIALDPNRLVQLIKEAKQQLQEM